MIRRHVFISGQVQGVGFRASLLQVALRYRSLQGYVRNRTDGRVEAVIQGEAAQVLEVVAWCSKGAPRSRITAVEVFEETPEEGLDRFRVGETV